MLQTLRNAWKIEELRKKIIFTLLIVLLYRIGNAIPVPYVNVDALKTYFDSMQNTMLGLYNVMSTPPLLSSCCALPFRLSSG